MLPVWAVLGHNVVYISVGFIWLSFADDGVTDEEVVTRERNHTYGCQLAAHLLDSRKAADKLTELRDSRP